MFCSRKNNNRINHLHERSLRLVYNDYQSLFDDLLRRDGSITVHHRNIHRLAIEIYKVIHKESTNIMQEIFVIRDTNYELRSQTFFVQSINTVHFGIESLRYFGQKIWNIIPNEIKASNSLKEFANRIKYWIPNECPCKLCRTYIKDIGYIN